MDKSISKEDEIALWVCPHCEVLQGIETRVDGEKIHSNCLSCGSQLPIEDVGFLSIELVKLLNHEVLSRFPKYFHDDIRFSWVSNKTLGLIFSIPQSELMQDIDFDIEDSIEEKLSDKYNMNITVYFE